LARGTPLTEEGVVVGSVPYMSPEQAEGKPVDARSDIFSFGAVLYEMVTGQRAFHGDSRASTLAAIVEKEPQPPGEIVLGTPPELERLISRCLRKDVNRRSQNMADVKLALEELREESESGRLRLPPATKKPATRGWLWPAVAVAPALCLCAGAAYLWFGHRTNTMALQAPVQLTRDRGLTAFPWLSADGQLLAYASDRDSGDNLDVYVRQVAGGQSIRLTRDEADDYDVSLSPDGTQVAFRSDRGQGGVYVVPTLGGEERLIAAGGRRPRFSNDGHWILYWVGHPAITDRGGGRIYEIPASGGVPKQLGEDLAGAGYPVWSPSGARVLFLGRDKVPDGPYGWWVVPTGGKPSKRVEGVAGAAYPDIWTPDGVLCPVIRGDSVNLLRYPVSERTLKATGEPGQVTSGIGMQSQATVSSGGDVAFSAVSIGTDLWTLPFDAERGQPAGAPSSLTRDDAARMPARISGDGRLLCYQTNRGGKEEIWLREFDTGKERMLAEGMYPVMSRDGMRVAYSVIEGDKSTQYVLNRIEGMPQKMDHPISWGLSSSGTIALNRAGQSDALQAVNLASGQATLLVEPGQYSIVYQPSFSPDNRWVGFVVKTGQDLSQIFLLPFREGVTPKREDWIQITDGNSWDSGPQWSPGGDVLYFPSERDGFRCLWGQRLDAATQHAAGAPFVARHFHESQRPSMLAFALLGAGSAGVIQFAVAADKIVYNLSRTTGNIWMMKQKRD
jgi:Tol biopolymer transport system component